MEVIYPVGENRADTLKYSLRALHKNMPEVERVTIIGHLPEYIDPTTVRHIKTNQGADPFWNTSKAIWLAAQIDLLPSSEGQFLLISDDVFLMRPHAPEFFLDQQVVRTRTARDFCNHLKLMNAPYHDAYVKYCRQEMEILEDWGFNVDEVLWGQSHHPMMMRQRILYEILTKIPPTHPANMCKALYAAHDDRPQMSERDCKIMRSMSEIPPGTRIVSTSRASWRGRVGKTIRFQFREQSPYEIPSEQVVGRQRSTRLPGKAYNPSPARVHTQNHRGKRVS